ncbi:virulence RhuM family protein [bacterium]|nr:virulence RhuM family protein [bacterium]
MTENNTSLIMYVTEDGVTRIQATFDQDTVWLSIDQMAELFQRDKSTISRHIKNVFDEHELDRNRTVANFATVQNEGGRLVERNIDYCNLDVIISVGYRVKSLRGTQFRIWANGILKDYLLKGYSVNQRIECLENRVSQTEEKIDFFVRTSLPPAEGIFFNGQIFDAYTFVCDLIRSAKKQIILFDNYIDDSVLKMLDKHGDSVDVRILTKSISPQLQLDIEKHNSQYSPIKLEVFTNSHDRFLCIDDTVYHIGASLKDLGKKWFAFSKMEIDTESLIGKM